MDELFPSALRFPPGFAYYPGFLTEAEQAHWHAQILKIELHPFTYHGFEAKRKTASFGYDYSFNLNTLTRGKNIPPVFQPLITRVAHFTGIRKEHFTELLITEYPPGAVINWHRDAFPFEVIAGISLLSDCIFRLRPYNKDHPRTKNILSLTLKQRSLYVIQGEARLRWQHSIAPVKNLRYSITLRTVKQNLTTITKP